MATAQFNVRVDKALADKLRREAKRRHQAPGVLVAEAIELLLSGNGPAPAQPLATDSPGLAEALAALTERVALLEQARPASPKRVSQPPQKGEPVIPQKGDALTTAELAEQTSTNRAAWNTWASKASPGDIRHHPQAGSWRLVGKAAAANGGPERWLWEPTG